MHTPLWVVRESEQSPSGYFFFWVPVKSKFFHSDFVHTVPVFPISLSLTPTVCLSSVRALPFCLAFLSHRGFHPRMPCPLNFPRDSLDIRILRYQLVLPLILALSLWSWHPMCQGKYWAPLSPCCGCLKQRACGFTFSLQTVLFGLKSVLKYVKPVANISSVWDVHTNSGILAWKIRNLGILFSPSIT